MVKKLEARVARLEKVFKNEAVSSTKWDAIILKLFNQENKGEYESYDDWKDEVLRKKLQSSWYSDNLTSRMFSQGVSYIAEVFLDKYETKDLKYDDPEFPVLYNALSTNTNIFCRCQIQDEDCWDVEISWLIADDNEDNIYFDKRIYFEGNGVLKKGTNYDCLVSYFNAYESFLNTSAAPIMSKFVEKYKSLTVDRKRLDEILSDIKDFYAQYKAACNDYLDEGGDEDDIEIAVSDINGVI